jgi:DNA-binding MarR family transcriptional regulator
VAHDLLTELKQTKPYASAAQEAHIGIVRTAALLSHAFEETLKPFGITATQYNVLRILRGAGPGGWCRSEIRDRMVTPVPDVTRLLDRLEDLGYVTRSRGVADRRHMATSITRSGLKLLERVENLVVEFHERLLGHLGPQRLHTLNVLLTEARKGMASRVRSRGKGLDLS